MKYVKLKLTIVLSFVLIFSFQAQAWHDQTHLAICKVAGFDNHWFNNTAEAEITPQMIFDQVEHYNKRSKIFDSEGHLPGAIIASLRAYDKDLRSGKYARYHLVYCAHYIGDLSQPLHDIAYDDFNKEHHNANDGIVEDTILDEPEKIAKHMYPISLSNKDFEADLAREIARIANLSRKLGYKLRAEKRDMTKQEAYVQLGHSASLLKAVLQHYNKTPSSIKGVIK
ncbi:MAG: hypothetical protein CVU55_03325 [Deltaproteobacteria bacterium HGW-Deltaproteobacteria-13]|nr:MAG: hypothetical protein CVU55_03325 [Deltaproteobacteria bacterium HGW-Deltaproteobacteria-13]